MTKYYPPQHKLEAFTCPYCRVYANQIWRKLYFMEGTRWTEGSAEECKCLHCSRPSIWYAQRMIMPTISVVPTFNAELPEDCQAAYDEAKDVVARSPRAAAALMRLVVQKLMIHLGEDGTNINADIKSLVSKGLPVVIQQALDICRVVGNNAVHPGEIDLNDTPEIAHSLFDMVNLIVDDRIARPKQIRELYEQLPKSSRDAVEKRDGLAKREQN